MKKIILLIIIFFSSDTYAQVIITGRMIRIKSDSTAYGAAARNQYLFVDKTGEFKPPTGKEYHILRICIPQSLRNDYPILYAYSSKNSCNTFPGIIVPVTKEMITKLNAVIQAKYKK